MYQFETIDERIVLIKCILRRGQWTTDLKKLCGETTSFFFGQLRLDGERIVICSKEIGMDIYISIWIVKQKEKVETRNEGLNMFLPIK